MTATLDIEQLLSALDLDTKVALVTGQDLWSLPAVPAIGLASLVMSDGPVGVRGVSWTAEDPSIALPSPTALAATWDPGLAHKAGRLLAQEARHKGVHVLLAPTVNLHRSPFGGRHFECYSEDPLLTAEIGAGYVAGLQDSGVAATVKHFVGNDSETERMTADVRIDERTLREMYLAPFERIVRAGVWAVMASYNGVNGHTLTENARLQIQLLKDEWGFDGIIVSDWAATRSTVESAVAGLDVAMPAMNNPWGEQLAAAVRSGAVAESVIDDKVRRVLRLAARVGALGGRRPAPEPVDGDAVAKEIAARSIVLTRNSDNMLPLNATELKRVAIIGALARDARVLGGGSASVFPPHIISPLAGLTAALPGAQVDYAIGTDPNRFLPAAVGPDWSGGFTAVFTDRDGTELGRTILSTGQGRWLGDLPEGIDPTNLAGVEISGLLTAAGSGEHQLAIRGLGAFRLTVDGESRFEDVILPEGTDPIEAFLVPPERRVPVALTAGEAVEVRLHQTIDLSVLPGVFVSLALGYAPPTASADQLIEEAVVLAAGSDVAIVVVGTTEEVESEGFDRVDLALPGRQDELVSRVAAANSKTVVVVNAGSPVEMPWEPDVAAVLLTWFPGQEGGAALADVLLGTTEPGGRLPTTWPRAAADCPVLSTTPVDGVLSYDEGIFIGYRAWERAGVEPMYGFGSGLGYTSWSYDSLEVVPGDGLGTAVVSLRNSGSRAGREVVQIYLSPAVADASRPARWLAGFAIATADPGESVTVGVPLPERAAQVWDDGWKTVRGEYLVEAAHSLAERRLSRPLSV
jgi:beta-glucosidase